MSDVPAQKWPKPETNKLWNNRSWMPAFPNQNDAEWWARGEIERLRAEVAKFNREPKDTFNNG